MSSRVKRHASSRTEAWERVRCNLCKSTKYKILWNDVKSTENDGTYQIVTCKKCRLIFLSPRPPKHQISKYYPKSRYWGVDLQESTGDEATDEYLHKNYGVVYDLILTSYTKGSILDIGAGTGGFLIPFQKKGWTVNGIEFSQDAVSYAKKKYGVPLVTGELEKKDFPKKSFDVITLNNALEHLYNPLQTLQVVHKLLKSNGMVVVTVPNFKSVGAILFKKKWYPLQPPIHLYHFTQDSLSQMLSVAGFQILDVKHSFFVHNYYSLFQSFRFLYTKQVESIGGTNIQRSVRNKQTILKRIGKLTGGALSFSIAKIEPFIKKGEVITVCAIKA